MSVDIIKIPELGYSSNCYIIYSKDNKKGYIVDPGGEAKIVVDYLEKNNIESLGIILTHPHADHIWGLDELKNKLKLPVIIHKDDYEMLKDAELNLSRLMFKKDIEIEADKIVEDGNMLDLDSNLKIKVIHTPGHTLGGICLYVDDILITGDTLFAGSIGRTDFPNGSFESIIESIKNKLLILSEDTRIFPGHGNSSTIGNEKKYNPFLQG